MNMIDSAVATNATNFYWNTSSNSDCCTNSNIIVTDPISTAVRYIPEQVYYSGTKCLDANESVDSKPKKKTPEEEKEEQEEKRRKEEERRVKESRKKYTPKKIYYNNPVTVVFWEDGTKTTVRLHEGEEYNEYSAFCAALAKKIFGNNSHLTKVVKSGIKPKKKSKKATEQH